MIRESLLAWLTLLSLLALASASGIALARRLPWTAAARSAQMPATFGLSLAPFVVGIASVIVLAALPGASRTLHLFVIFTLSSIGLLAALKSNYAGSGAAAVERWNLLDRLIAALLVVAAAALVFVACATPLVQNDSLEYATIGRLLFESRSLASVPVLDPQSNSAGAYYPWTHPPLYVGLIYLTYQLQDGAEVPGLMRLLAPWFLIAAALLTYSLARGTSRRAGLIAALLLLTTPLLFTGSIAGLMDGLPVLGFAAIIAAVVGIETETRWRAVLIGAALGLALWTHSQAILLIPLCLAALVFASGLSRPLYQVRDMLIVLAIAATIGAWPYVRNLFLMGALIVSDSLLATLPAQDWAGYFEFNRGLDTPAAVIQYGVFKGWFAFEAYGLLFWFMAFGVGCFLVHLRGRVRSGHALRAVLTEQPAVWICLGLVLCYLAGVVASIVVGIDALVRNERYALMIVPAVAVLAAYGLAEASRRCTRTSMTFLSRAILTGALLALGAQALLLSVFMVRPSYAGVQSFARPVEAGLWAQPPFAVIDYIRNHTPRDALILSLKTSDMYYAGRRMVSYGDPRLVRFYSQTDVSQAVQSLRDLGVTHIQVSDYDLPNFYDSMLQTILRDPRFATLLVDVSGYQLYAFAAAAIEEGPRLDLTASATRWSRISKLVIGGRRALASVVLNEAPVADPLVSDSSDDLGLFQRDRSASLRSAPVSVHADREYALDLQVQGRGAVRVWLRGSATDGTPRGRFMCGDTFLNERKPLRNLGYRFRIPHDWAALSLELEHLGSSRLDVRAATLIEMQMKTVAERNP